MPQTHPEIGLLALKNLHICTQILFNSYALPHVILGLEETLRGQRSVFIQSTPFHTYPGALALLSKKPATLSAPLYPSAPLPEPH